MAITDSDRQVALLKQLQDGLATSTWPTVDDALTQLFDLLDVTPNDLRHVSTESITRWFGPQIGNVVYFIATHDYRFVKIGTTRRLTARLSEYAIANPDPLLLIGTLPGGYDVEKQWHRNLTQHHHRGEWFHLNDLVFTEITDAIRTYETR